MEEIIEMFKNELEICKNNNPEEYEYIERAISEFVTEFTIKYGNEYNQYVIDRLKETIPNINYHYYSYGGGETAESGTKSVYVLIKPHKDNDYTINILKHEFWHILNDATKKGAKKVFVNIPKRYKNVLQENDIKKERFSIAGEQWNEYFNKTTHNKGMKTNFYALDNGFYFKQISTQASYDYVLGISDGIVALTSINDIFKAHMENGNPNLKKQLDDIINDFDEEYEGCLDEGERGKFKYPYLKLELDADEIWDKQPNCSVIMQDAFKTIFKAYSIKLNDIENISDISQLEEIYGEIKSMQSAMPYNMDLSKMKGTPYINELEKIQNRVIELSDTYIPKNEEEKNKLKYFKQNLNYENECKKIENYEDFAIRVEDACQTEFDKKVMVDNYEFNTNDNGIKDNIYKSIKLALGNDYYKFILKDYKKERQEFLNIDEKYNEKNILEDLFEKINQIPNGDNSKDSIDKSFEIFDTIYLLMLNKLKNEFPMESPDANVCSQIERMLDSVNELNSVGVFNKSEKKYHPRLEDIFDYAEEYTNRYLENKNKLGKKCIAENSYYKLKDESKRDEFMQERIKSSNEHFEAISSNLKGRIDRFKYSDEKSLSHGERD